MNRGVVNRPRHFYRPGPRHQGTRRRAFGKGVCLFIVVLDRNGRQGHHSQQCELRGSEIRPKHFLGGHAKVDQDAGTKSEGQRHVGSIAAAGDQNPADPRIIVAGVECVPAPTQKDLDPGGKVLRRMRRRQADVADVAGTIARGMLRHRQNVSAR